MPNTSFCKKPEIKSELLRNVWMQISDFGLLQTLVIGYYLCLKSEFKKDDTFELLNTSVHEKKIRIVTKCLNADFGLLQTLVIGDKRCLKSEIRNSLSNLVNCKYFNEYLISRLNLVLEPWPFKFLLAFWRTVILLWFWMEFSTLYTSFNQWHHNNNSWRVYCLLIGWSKFPSYQCSIECTTVRQRARINRNGLDLNPDGD